MPRDDATPTPEPPRQAGPAPPGPGGMAARVAAFDWSATPLGRMADWPAALRVAADLVLGAASPAMLAWGEDFIVIHNDPYRTILGPEREALGRPMLDVWPEIRDELGPLLRRARDGETLRFTEAPFVLRRGGAAEERWFDYTLGPVRKADGRPGGVLNLVVEVTEGVLATRSRDALIALGDAMRGTEDPAEIASLAARTLAETLRVPHAGYGTVDAAGSRVTVARDWHAPDLPSAAGVWDPVGLWDGFADALRRGETVAVPDVAADARTAVQREAFAAVRVTACVHVPVLRDGRLAALVFLHDTAPRAWTAAEVAFARDVAGRVAAAVERAEAIAALRESEDHHRHAVELRPQTSWTALPDGQLDRVNARWMEWTGTTGLGSTWAEGLHPDDGPRTFEVWARSVTTGETYDIHHRVKMRDGTYRWAHSRAYPRRDARGAIVKWYGVTEDVHDRFVAQETLREGEARLRALNADLERQVAERAHERSRTWQVSPDLIGVANADGYFESVNPGFEAALGWSAEEMRRTVIFDLIHPDDQESTLATLNHLRGDNALLRFENRYRRRDGGYRWLSWVAVPEGGKFYCSARDVTEEKERADELARRTVERDRLWRNSLDLLLVVGSDGVFRSVSPSFTTVLGFTPEELVGRFFLDLIHPDDHPRALAALATATEGPLPTVEVRYAHRDGSWRRISWVAAPEGDLIYATGRDVTAERAAAEELTLAQARMRTQFETSYQLQGLLATDGTLLAANATALAPIGATEDEVLGLPFAETPWFTGTPGMTEVAQVAIATAAGGTSARLEITLNLPVGYRTYDFSIRPIRDEAGNVVALAAEAMDLTERRAAEDALRQAQKMEAVGQLTGGIAHDFNNMLAVVMGGLALLKRRLERGETDVLRYVDAAMEGATRAAALTQRLLAFSRQQALSPAPLDVNRLVEGMTELLDRTLGERIRVETSLAPDLAPVYADPVQLESAILNLSVNARDAMPEGGTLAIGTANVRITPAQARRIEVVPGDYVRITVTDSGTGMAPEVAARAFDPFFTTKGIGRGTGLGLSQVFGFVRQSGGHVAIGSAQGRGTTITVVLPRHAGPAPVAADGAAASAGDGRGETVLVVEDEERVRALAVESLRELGYRVLEAGSAEEALPVIEGDEPVALLFTDVVMPGMGGLRLAEIATARRPGLKVLFATGFAEGGVPSGAAVLNKPFGIETLSARVRAVLDG